MDRVTYSVPIRHAYRPVWVKLYHDRVAIAVGAEVVAEHRRVFCRTAALERHSPRLETVRLILRQQQAGPPPVCPPVAGVRPELARIAVPTPTLSAYDALVEGSC